MKKPNLNLTLGKDIEGNYYNYDLERMHHLLIGGDFSTGKTQFFKNLIKQLIDNNSPEEIKFIFVDCDKLDLINFANVQYMNEPVITDPKKATEMFKWLEAEQERRFDLLKKEMLRTTDDYNQKYNQNIFPKIIVIVSELANLRKEYSKIEMIIVKIMQLSKYSGITIILETQKSDSKNLTCMVRANIGSRVVFKTQDKKASRFLLYQNGAEELNGKGEFLFMSAESSKPIKLQGDYISK